MEKGQDAGKSELVAAVRVRGNPKVKKEIRDTLKMLRLNRVNHCVLVPKTPDFEGMLRKSMNYVTYGEIDRDTLEALILKRGRKPGNKRLEKQEAKELAGKAMKVELKGSHMVPVFRLSPPSGGHSEIRRLYPKGSLGYRGGDINKLLKRMM